MANLPLISVITIVYNDLKGLKKTVKSVLDQRYSNLEYIVIDGASVDGSAEFIRDNATSFTFSVSEKDKGIADAFNKGLAQSKGKWILFLNAGDTFYSNGILAEVSSSLKTHPESSIIYGKVNVVDENDRVLRSFGRAFNENSFKREMTIPHQGAFHNKNIFEEVGLYDLDYSYCMDYELLLRLKKTDFTFIDIVIANMLAGGVSQESPKEVYKEFNKVKKKHLNSSTFQLNMDLYENMLRYRLSKLKRRLFKK